MSDATDEKTLARAKAAMEKWERQHPITPDRAECQRLCGGGHDGWH